MQLPWRQQVVEGMLGADLVGFQRPVAAQNFMQICAPPLRRASDAHADPVPGPHGQGRRLPRLDRLRRVRRHRRAPRDRRGRGRAPARARLARGASCSGSTGSTTPRASTCACRPSASCSRAASRTPARPCSCRSRRRAASASAPTASCASASSAPWAASTASSGASGTPRSTTSTTISRAKTSCALYAAADVMLVTPLRDGMNLVCKEYVATRHRGGGVLVLSEFAGAAGELRQALLVNPHDVVGMRETIAARHLAAGRARPGGACATCAARCARMTSTASPARSSRRSRRRAR